MGLNNIKTDNCILIHKNQMDYYTIPNLSQVQQEMLNLLNIVNTLCKQNGLKFWLDGGTLLGAIRHKGFIPWDDDVDISILKKDYLQLIHLLEEYCNQHPQYYLLYSGKDVNQHCCNYLCSSFNLVGRQQGSYCIYPIKLDIRPVNVINNAPKSIQLNTELRSIANEFLFGKNKVNYTDISKTLREMSRVEFFQYYNNEYGLEEKQRNNLLSFPYFEYACEDNLKVSLIEDLIDTPFENIALPIPKDYDGYLKLLYGDYMALPSIDSRVPAAYEYLELRHYNNKSIRKTLMGTTSFLNKGWIALRTFGLQKFLSIIHEKYSK